MCMQWSMQHKRFDSTSHNVKTMYNHQWQTCEGEFFKMKISHNGLIVYHTVRVIFWKIGVWVRGLTFPYTRY